LKSRKVAEAMMEIGAMTFCRDVACNVSAGGAPHSRFAEAVGKET
jgi:hypothetical protein